MKLREYTNCVHSVLRKPEKKVTVGYPCKLPLFPTQFAIVRPPSDLFDFERKGWQVIHIKSGLRIGSGPHKSKVTARLSAMAELEYQFKRLGEKKVRERIG